MNTGKTNPEGKDQAPALKLMAYQCWELAKTNIWPEKKFWIKDNKRMQHNLFFFLVMQQNIEDAYCNFCNNIRKLAQEQIIDPPAETILSKDGLLQLGFVMFSEDFDTIPEHIYFREALLEMMHSPNSTLVFHWHDWQRRFNRSYKRMVKRQMVQLQLDIKRTEIRRGLKGD